ncbi:HIT family protein [Moritella viscosa]|uniref:Diadenosine tetraphosphate hydrolase n=1 Tax=Moritella viscosa TaxID=80854 RepID=A0A1L0AI43_9GAMM|nr:HIT family protein [Moritella viscosa]SGZ01348.1 Diadenosine tetraphosphate hydrolase [Moritella viscosa]SGZ07948.1 Diadenosine tetraphosphate hydrolase [Moritella viscosa]SGZ15521.1 Diadenosine tetraphosphate hydrolase [Moritella viscosa]SGZ18930.1 Diadenosine tetraphosphate hydrolase [Moritella viscosa]SHO15214.1 Diadenosine tetraphosphate hydrolase [Moritella viscosa]
MTIVEKIVAREIDAVIVYESEFVIAFADHDPINFGHILICPIQPYESFIDLPRVIHNEINDVAKDLFQRINDKFSPDGISFIQNNGRFNELSHYHLHIFPRFEDDQFGWKSSDLGMQNIEKLRESLACF